MPLTRRHLAAAAVFTAIVAAGPAAVAQPAEEAAVAQAVEKLRTAMLAADRSQLEALTAPQLSYGHSGGVVEDKARFIDVIASKRTIYKTITLSDQSIVMAGDEAIVRHVFSTDFESGGSPGSSRVGVMQVWQKRDGQWRLLARQAFRI
jgi:ketosteroid isomerase-like protein